ncbi:MAG: diguanylate cyclase [Deltaproteobacteria bacterium]|uniref:Diguanylate cyclase n=1 Tax=Candidatus Zymogenus saltonus TaxID=2844893 RepID=A0A9D8KDJ1_9DELT|nr:diguanylate cyclase [Candidatus Zymogenus saltonus]
MKDGPTLVLLVEDDQVYANLIREIFEDTVTASFDLLHAESIEKAIKYLAKKDVGIILLDLMLPDSSGLDTFLKIKGEAAEIPIVIITSLDDEKLALEALNKGADEYLFKIDVRPDNLIRSLRYVMERRKAGEEIRNSEEKLRTLFMGFPLPSYTWRLSDGDFILVDYNRAAREITGGKIDEMLNIRAEELHSDKPEIVREIARCLKKNIVIKKDYEYSYRSLKKTRFLTVTMMPASPESVFVFTEDITDRKKAEEELKKSRDNLEVDIKKRMKELSEINEKLELEIEERKKVEEALRKSEEQFKRMIEQSPFSIQVMNTEGKIVNVNRSWEKLWEGSLDDLKDYNILEDEQLERLGVMSYVERAFSGEETVIPPVEYVTTESPKIVKRWVEGYFYPVRDSEGEINSIILISRDITEQKETERTMRISDWAMKSSISAIVLFDLNGIVTYVNPSFLNMWGYDDISEVIGLSWEEIWYDEGRIRESIDSQDGMESWVGEVLARKKDGSLFNVQLSASLVIDEEEKPISIMGSLVDITNRKKLEEELWTLSITDSLTGLYNQRYFYRKIEEEAAKARRMSYPICLMIFDLDNFKQYNDRYGHQKGDDVLREIGEITKKSVRRESDAAFRYGGDEFAVILPNAKKEDALEVAKRIEREVSKTFKDIGISFGIEILTEDIAIEEFIRAADVAMYREKGYKTNDKKKV